MVNETIIRSRALNIQALDYMHIVKECPQHAKMRQ